MFTVTDFPEAPGCYLFRDASKKIIYIGKAKNLKKRLKSYLQKKQLDAKTRSLLRHIDSVSFIITDTEVEALIVPVNLSLGKMEINVAIRERA